MLNQINWKRIKNYGNLFNLFFNVNMTLDTKKQQHLLLFKLSKPKVYLIYY
jgi:hypothetical protein